MFLPYLYGERAPVWDGAASGAFVGIRSWHSQAAFLRAALEGVCYGLNQILEIIESASGPVHQLQVSGGFVHSFTWMQILADITGKRLSLIQTEDASALGAALLGLRLPPVSEDPANLSVGEENFIEPNFSHHDTYQKYYKVYKSLYPTLHMTMQQLRNAEND
jgi:gluconokinase